MEKTHHNKKVAASRGATWKKKLIDGHMEAASHPSKLRVARSRLGFSQEAVAAFAELSESTYQAIERGRRPTSKEAGLKIAGLLKLSLDKLFTKAQNKYQARF